MDFVLLLLAVVFILLVPKVIDAFRNVRRISYSDLFDKAESNEIASIHLYGNNTLVGQLKDGTQFRGEVPKDDKILEILREHDVDIRYSKYPFSMSLWRLFIIALLLWHTLLLVAFVVMPLTKQQMDFKIYSPQDGHITFKDVAGLGEAKEELQDFINYLKDPKKYGRLGAKITRGLLLVGDPGNGKTLLARAVAGEAGVPFFNVSASQFVEMYVGVGAARVRKLFEQARGVSPCVVFIDELDAIGAKRNNSSSGSLEYNQTLNQLLTELDGFESHSSPVIVIAATNRPDALDSALLRAGRFDRRIDVPYPDLKSREEILEIHTKKISLDPSVNLETIARGTPGFSSVDIANLVNEAAINATKDESQDTVMIKDFEEARDKITLGKESKSKILTEEDKKVTAFHESGHALVALLLPDKLDPLHKITIIPRGSALGVTHSLPEREKYTKTKEEMLGEIQRCLGGRVAEELEFNMIGSGPSSDFEKATAIARQMVCRYGMTDLGLMVMKNDQQPLYSQKTAELIDAEINKILNGCYSQVKKLLQDNRDMLTKLSNTLLEKETMYASEVYALLGITPREDFKWA